MLMLKRQFDAHHPYGYGQPSKTVCAATVNTKHCQLQCALPGLAALTLSPHSAQMLALLLDRVPRLVHTYRHSSDSSSGIITTHMIP